MRESWIDTDDKTIRDDIVSIAKEKTGLPSAALLENVEQALYGHELMGFDTRIKAPEVTDATVAVEFAGDADRAEVALAVENYVHGLGIGGRFAIRELCALPKPFNRTAASENSRDYPAGTRRAGGRGRYHHGGHKRLEGGNMIKWIEKNINPPGLANKNRLALFSTIGGIADTVRKAARQSKRGVLRSKTPQAIAAERQLLRIWRTARNWRSTACIQSPIPATPQ
jgi:hypothetical protein